MSLSNDIVLRPRFKINLNQSNQNALNAFDDTKTTQIQFIVTRIDDHVFIKLPKVKQLFWSPQLHLEINEDTKNSSILHGLFGPNPTVWTLFMFFHFTIAVTFIGFAIWGYTNWSLKKEFYMQILICSLLAISWFILYFGGRIGKYSSKGEMLALHLFMTSTLGIQK